MNKTVVIVAATFVIGAMSGYWFRGQVQIAREQAEIHEFLAGPPHVLALAPPGPPAPLISAPYLNNPKVKR
jgi:hypothetical protein